MPLQKPDRECILFQNAFLFSSDAIVLTNLAGKITDINKAFTEMFGWERDEIIGKTTSLLRSRKTDDNTYKKMWDSIEKFGEWKGEITNRHKTGREIPVLLSITPIIQDGVRIGYMGIEIDMTERIKLDQRMAQSERLATIGKMAAKVAHEIRNPLSSISLNAELLQDEISSGNFNELEANALLTSIMNEVDRLANLTNEYLLFSRLPMIHKEKHNICKLLKNLGLLIEKESKNKQINLRIELPDEPVFLYIDKDQIHRVILNLVRNSIEALSLGGEIEIHLQDRTDSVEIKIADNGSGIPEDTLENIFEPFYTTKDIGTGLGLPISKQIIEDHQGTLSYVSRDIAGACFLISLPKNKH